MPSESIQMLAARYLAAHDALGRALDTEQTAKRMREEASSEYTRLGKELKDAFTPPGTVVIPGDGTRMVVVSSNFIAPAVAEVVTGGADTPTQDASRGFWLDSTTSRVVDAPETASLINVRYLWLSYNRHRGYFVDPHGRAWKEVPAMGMWTLV